MSAAEKRRAAVALLACLATPDIGDLVHELDDEELRRDHAKFLSRLAALRDREVAP